MMTGTLTSGRAWGAVGCSKRIGLLLPRRRDRYLLVRRDRAFRDAEALRQQDVRRANDVTAPAFDAVLQSESRQGAEVGRRRRDEQVLRQQARGAHQCAIAAAN